MNPLSSIVSNKKQSFLDLIYVLVSGLFLFEARNLLCLVQLISYDGEQHRGVGNDVG